jgi:short-subunit dehydrogenase
MNKENTIIITGASSGIGKALALQYALENKNLSLISRSKDALIPIKEQCINYGAKNVDIIVGNVVDSELMKTIIHDIDSKYNIEIVFCSAGISSGTADESSEIDNQIINTNILGTINTINPIIPIMKKQKFGQIGLFSSLAQFIPIPQSSSYILTKSAIKTYGECLNLLLDNYNIGVSIIMPGFVISKMSKASNYKNFSMMKAEKAAYLIKEGIAKKKDYIIFPKISFILLKLFSILPFVIKKYLIKQFMNEKY